MPFALKLKKKKQYNVVSKSVFVMIVELLDCTILECTISMNSLGLECLQNVCQKLSLPQIHYFGLQFQSKFDNLWWVDLDAPLKKQIDKLAANQRLYLRVIHFAIADNFLHDEVMRYHFFLHLKNDIIESRLECNPSQAVLLASYSLQAEFGNYDIERHTTEYLKNFVILPKHFSQETKETLLEQVIQAHTTLKGISASLAEISYIKEAQRLDGYGKEYFPAKDSLNLDVTLGISLYAINIKSNNGHPTIILGWGKVENLFCNRKTFSIECLQSKTMHFLLSDSNYSKYVHRIASEQHQLYRGRNIKCIPLATSVSHPLPDTSTSPQNTLSLTQISSEVPGENEKIYNNGQDSQVSLSSNTLNQDIPVYRTPPDYKIALKLKYDGVTKNGVHEENITFNNNGPIDPRIQFLENRLLEGKVFQEFEQIIRKKVMSNFSTALLSENLSRNRFKDVLPYEENRVKLTPTMDNVHGYINASHISISRKCYIASQGPLGSTVAHFWQMVWEYNITLIVMLTGLQEQGLEKCFPYWPLDTQNVLTFGDFAVNKISGLESGAYSTSQLTVTHGAQHRTIWHIQYLDWPDHCCPQDISGFLNFMEEIDSVQRMSNGQLLIHCSAGVGRSGVVMLCDIMFHALNHNEPIDVPNVLTELRKQRMLSVQTLAQYQFAYKVLIEYLKKCRLI